MNMKTTSSPHKLSDFFGTWPLDEEEATQIKNMIQEDRKKSREEVSNHHF